MPTTIDAPMLSPEEFASALKAVQARFRPEDTRFVRALMTGRCPRAVILRYARSTYLSAKLFCATVAEFAHRAPTRDARLTLIENLLEEEGMHINPNVGLVARPEAKHVALALRFLRACGGDADDDAQQHAAVHATGVGRAMLAEGRWTEAVAYLLVGQELKFGHASAVIREGLRRNGFAERDLAFFSVHIEMDSAHGEEAVQLVVANSATRAEQKIALAAAEAGARAWFEMHGGGTLETEHKAAVAA